MESLAPFLQGTCTPYNMPVYPGARSITANPAVTSFNNRYSLRPQHRSLRREDVLQAPFRQVDERIHLAP
jgi:hypothetical protein